MHRSCKGANSMKSPKPISVILDTDIGCDIDDTWALAMLLKSPELDLKLVVSDEGDTEYRAKLLAKMLTIAGRHDVPVGIGIGQNSDGGPLTPWVADYDLASYPGRVYSDGVNALIQTIMQAQDPVTFICIGPMPNMSLALERNPAIAGRCHFIGMHGSVFCQYGGAPGISAEYNVVKDIAACRAVFNAPWLSKTITPLDTCDNVRLGGERYQRLVRSTEPCLAAVLENYRIWAASSPGHNPAHESTVLYDTVAVYLAFSRALLNMQRIPISIDDKGFTLPAADGAPIDVAVTWRDKEAYLDFLAERLLQEVVR
jgi:inosine-uridine nucleoside N-ribohydrolase